MYGSVGTATRKNYFIMCICNTFKKRVSLVFTALLVVTTSFATVTYELNGGVTNPKGWQSKDDMYKSILTELNTICGVARADLDTVTLAGDKAKDIWSGIPSYWSTIDPAEVMADSTFMADFGWLLNYMDTCCATEGMRLATSGSVYLRYNLAAFFVESQRTGWPESANYILAGTYDAYSIAWKHAYANPTEPKDSVALNAPCKDGFTFVGWYTNKDFMGDKITHVDSTTSGTLYAKWVEYIPNIAEVKSLANNTKTQVMGIVNYIRGDIMYIQDGISGIRVCISGIPNCYVGQRIIAKGTKSVYNGIPEVKNAEILFSEDAKLYVPIKVGALNKLKEYATLYLGKRICIEGLMITRYDQNYPVVTDGIDTVLCCISLDETEYPVRTIVTITAVADYYDNELQFVGYAKDVEEVAIKHDAYIYPERGENGEYTLENNWIVSVNEDNIAGRRPGPTGNVRGMAAKDGKMYFINRANASITVVDGATGTILDPIKIKGEHMFQTQDSTGAWKDAVSLAYNDIRFDGAGNCLIGACMTTTQTFFIYKVDLATGEATELVKEHLYSNPNFKDNGYRFDAFGVYGDVNNTAIIMATDANSFNAYKWTITNGKAGKAEQINCTINPEDKSLLLNDGVLSVTNFGYAPQTTPISENLFYVDGRSTLPMLFDMKGTLQDDFFNCPTGLQVANNEGDTCTMNTGHNGLVEFQVGDEYFLLLAATNTAGTPASTFALYKFADEAKEFAGLEPMWYFPANGMGAVGGVYAAVPSVEVEGNVATIYLYTNSGYASYTFCNKMSQGDIPTFVENDVMENISVRKVFRNGQVLIQRGTNTYTLTGVEVR
mgnify:FL=1